jgi:hypothetical protein
MSSGADLAEQTPAVETSQMQTKEELPDDCVLLGEGDPDINVDQDEFEEAMLEVAAKGNKDLKAFVQQQRAAEDPDGEDGQMLGLLETANQQEFAAGTPLAQRMNRKLTPEQKAEYAALKGHAAKAAWRLKWANTQYETIVKKKVHLESWDIEDTSAGEYMSLSMIIKHEGGKSCPQAVLAGRKYVPPRWSLGGVE